MSKTQNPFMNFGVTAEDDNDTDAKARAKRSVALMIEIGKKIAELIMRLLMIPFNFLQGIFHPELLAQRNLKQAAANKSAATDDMEAAMERRLQRRLQARRQPPPAPRVKTESEIVADALKDVADIRALNASELCRLPPDWFAWLDNLTPAEAREAMLHPVDDIVRHLKGEVILPGVREILTDAERVELKAAMDKASPRYRYDPLTPIPEPVEPDELVWSM